VITEHSRFATIEDAPEIERILNDESVRGYAGVPRDFDVLGVADTFDKFRYFLFDGGFVLFRPLQIPGAFEGHIAALKGHRGENALDGSEAALEAMFSSGLALYIFVSIEPHRRDIRNLVTRLGFIRIDRTNSYMLDYERWKEGHR